MTKKEILSMLRVLELSEQLVSSQIELLTTDLLNLYYQNNYMESNSRDEIFSEMNYIFGYGDALKNSRSITKNQVSDFLKIIKKLIENQAIIPLPESDNIKIEDDGLPF